MKYQLVTSLLALLLMSLSVFANEGAFGQPCHIEIDVVAKKDVEESLDHNSKEVRFAISKCPAALALAKSLSSKHDYIIKSVLFDGTLAQYLMFRNKSFQCSPRVSLARFWTTDNESVNEDIAEAY